MNSRSNILFFTLVFLLQLVISDYVHLGPWLFLTLLPFLIISIPLNRSVHWVMLSAFAMGILLDVLSDGVVGLNAFAAVLAAAPRKFFYRILVNGDRQDDTLVSTPAQSGLVKYLKFLGAVTAVYVAGYLLLDCVGSRPAFFVATRWVASTLLSTGVCLLLAFAIQNRK